jgi:hypothetical protein
MNHRPLFPPAQTAEAAYEWAARGLCTCCLRAVSCPFLCCLWFLYAHSARVLGSVVWSALAVGGRRWCACAWLCSIIYAQKRETTADLAQDLTARGFPAVAYHAGMKDAERSDAQRKFMVRGARERFSPSHEVPPLPLRSVETRLISAWLHTHVSSRPRTLHNASVATLRCTTWSVSPCARPPPPIRTVRYVHPHRRTR